MKKRKPDMVRAGAILTFFVLGLAAAASSRADDDAPKTDVAAMPAPERVVRLPARKVGGVRSGYELLITESGTELLKPATLAQRQLPKPSPFNEFCFVR
jgi:hypothetical protein